MSGAGPHAEGGAVEGDDVLTVVLTMRDRSGQVWHAGAAMTPICKARGGEMVNSVEDITRLGLRIEGLTLVTDGPTLPRPQDVTVRSWGGRRVR